MKKTINVMGTEYSIEIHKFSEDGCLKEKGWSGYCDGYAKRIVIADLDDPERFKWTDETEKDAYVKQILRHEIVHAFFSESGLNENSARYTGAWSNNEEMVDWIASQFPKMLTVFKDVGCL